MYHLFTTILYLNFNIDLTKIYVFGKEMGDEQRQITLG